MPCRGESGGPANGASPGNHGDCPAEDDLAQDDERRKRFLTHLSMGDESSRNLLGDDAQAQNSNPSSSSMAGFLRSFASTDGPPQIIILCLLLAVALGSTISVVPAV